MPRDWLRSLLPGYDRDRAQARETLARLDEAARNWVPSQDFIDHGERLNLAARDPDFPAKRTTAVAAITAAITSHAKPLGYTRKGGNWRKPGKRGETTVQLQRSSYGFNCWVNLIWHRADGRDPGGVWARDEVIRLGRFFLPGEGVGPEPGRLAYLDVHDDPATLELPMAVLATRALPWLDAHHRRGALPEITDFLQAPPGS